MHIEDLKKLFCIRKICKIPLIQNTSENSPLYICKSSTVDTEDLYKLSRLRMSIKALLYIRSVKVVRSKEDV